MLKPGSVTSAGFVISGLFAFILSADLLGTGLWGFAIVGVSTLVGIAPYLPIVLPIARGLATLAAVLAIIAVVLGLLAATTGGSFKLPGDQGLLLFLLFLLAVFGILFGRSKNASEEEQNT
ncbi:MAG: hypothetical protein GKR90_02145 [Pseudomonadales bacterium]|nr:hypothetical protein [Pseudomonadales bacterium]